jgi:catechol 2,3-dioxygenase-like lactoylglutathione lyase family enzyme
MRFSAGRALFWLAAVTVIVSPGYSASAQAAADARLVRPNAVIHSVANLGRSVAFYRDAVGLDLDSTPGLPAGSGREIGLLTNAAGAEIRTATFKIPGTEVRLVLMQVSKSDGKNVVSRIQDPGVVKLVLRVRSMETAFARVRGQIAGVYTTGGAPVRPEGPNGVNQAVIMKDPDGCALEFVFQTNPPLSENLPADSNVVGGWASFVVEDLAKSIEFYRDGLGFAIVGSGRPAAATLLALEGTPEATGTVSTGSRPPGAAYTWFMYDFRGIERKTLQTRLQDPGAAAVSFWVDNLSGLLTRLKAAGTRVETAGGEPLMVGGSRRAFIRDPSGILIELAELPPAAAGPGR